MSPELYGRLECAQKQPGILMNWLRPAHSARSSAFDSDGHLAFAANEKGGPPLDLEGVGTLQIDITCRVRDEAVYRTWSLTENSIRKRKPLLCLLLPPN